MDQDKNSGYRLPDGTSSRKHRTEGGNHCGLLVVENRNLQLKGAPMVLVDDLRRTFIVDNPEWQKRQTAGRGAFGVQKELSFIKVGPDGEYMIPRGYEQEFRARSREMGIKGRIVRDVRTLPEAEYPRPVDLEPDHQVEAAAALEDTLK